MKSTIKTSRTAGQLEKMFRELNKHYYNGELPEPIITLKKTPSAYGHITTVKTWTVSTEQGTEQRYEINISTATLDPPPLRTPRPPCCTRWHTFAIWFTVSAIHPARAEPITTSALRPPQRPTA